MLTGAVIHGTKHMRAAAETVIAAFTLMPKSSWVVTGDSELTSLYSEGAILDADGNTVTIVGTDGTVYMQGAGAYTITVSSFSNQCNLSDVGSTSSWSDYEVSFQ